jgi:hypothetical protein
MTRRSRIWLAVAVLFSVVNLAGAGFAAARGELLHAGTHVGLALLGAYVAWRLVPRRHAHRIWRQEATVSPPTVPSDLADRLTHLEQAVDAVAIEVERIGEGQRFIMRSVTEHAPPRPPGKGAEEQSGDAAPHEPRG